MTSDDKHIIKAKGIDNSKNIINYNSFMELFKGNSITVKQIQFNKDLKSLNINIRYIDKTIEGIKDPNIHSKIVNRKLIVYNKDNIDYFVNL